jgi:hypothetical protein
MRKQVPILSELNDIESKLREAEGERTALEAQLQQAIMAGRDTGKLHTSIDQLTHSLRDLQSAHDGYSRRREQLSKQEEAESKQALIVKHRQQSDDLEAATKEFAAAIEKARVVGSNVAGLARQHERTVGELEALGERRLSRASGIIRNTIGKVRRGDDVSEYGRRIDIGLEEVISDNPSILRRAQVLRRGRVGETNEARDMATEGWMKLARAK